MYPLFENLTTRTAILLMGAAITKKAQEDQISVFVLRVFHSCLSPMLSVVCSHKAELTELFFAESNNLLFVRDKPKKIQVTLNS